MERDKPPALPISIVTPAAYMAHDSKLQIHTWGESGTGVVFIIDIRWHYEYGNKLSKAAGRQHMQM